MASTHHELARDAASPLSTQAAEIGWSTDLTTKRGVRFSCPPAQPSYEEDLAAFFRSLPSEDLRHRFLTGLGEVGHERLKEMVRNDDPHTISFLAVDEPSRTIAATAMLVASKDYSEEEFALSTRSEWKQKGISWTLLDHLVSYARAAGIETIKSIEKSDDGKALQLEREMGFTVHHGPEDSTLMIAEKALTADR